MQVSNFFSRGEITLGLLKKRTEATDRPRSAINFVRFFFGSTMGYIYPPGFILPGYPPGFIQPGYPPGFSLETDDRIFFVFHGPRSAVFHQHAKFSPV